MTEDKTKSTVTGDTTKSTVTINDENPKVDETPKAPETPKPEGTVLGTVTSDELGVTTETAESTTNNAADSALNIVDSIQKNNADNESESEPTPAPKPKTPKPAKAPKGPVKAPENAPKETDTAEPWGDKAPVSEDDLINELFYHGGVAKDVAKNMIDKLKAIKDPELKANMINHIAWHIATGGPKNKINGGKGKALHKEDIVTYLNTL